MDLWGFPWGAHGYPKMDASWNIPWEHPMKWMLCTVWERLFDHWTFSSRTYRQADKCEWLREGLKSVRHLVLDEALRNWTSRHVADMSHPEMPCPERLTGLSSRDTSKSWIKSWNFCRLRGTQQNFWINSDNSLPKVPVCGATSTATWQDMQRQ